MIRFSELPAICSGVLKQLFSDREIRDVVLDSRKMLRSETALFFAIAGERHDGHQYISELYRKGIRQFVVEKRCAYDSYPQANFLLVDSSIAALQALVAFHRNQLSIPVIGITGSNGKTIIKEWLFQLLSPDFQIAKNPGSYNSQIGVPLSVWQLQPYHQLGIFEAGISQPGEMERLEEIIRPTIGIFSNLGTAHDEGFDSAQEKVKEKLHLFARSGTLIYCSDNSIVHHEIERQKIPAISWGFEQKADYWIQQEKNKITLSNKETVLQFELPFSDRASIENIVHCIVLMLKLNYAPPVIQERILHIQAVAMRLELKQGINNCQLIDDSYNNDLGGLQISLDFLTGLQKKRKTLILSDILQTGLEEKELTTRIRELILKSGINKFIAVGPVFRRNQNALQAGGIESEIYPSTEEALQKIQWERFQNETILVKGARAFQFERLVNRLLRKVHGTRMEIDLNKMVHNLNFFKSRLQPGVKLMVMVKAFAYGSGSEEVANVLQYHRVDYLGVAYADEGAELRKNHITLPIMVMNSSEESYPTLLTNNLEPVVYSLALLNSLVRFLENRPCRIHLEIETGMHRLGLEPGDVEEAVRILKSQPNITVASIFSHLAGADEQQHDSYSKAQVEIFDRAYQTITQELKIKPIRHILNSPGILRLPHYQMDMVRLGIGLYGVNPTSDPFEELKPVATLKTVISQIKNIKPGDSIGYGRWGRAQKEMKVATIAIGYADGFSRSFSRGVGKVRIKDALAPVVGNVCMDMTMVDVTGIEAHEGDDVIIFGEGLPIQTVAASIQTIPYEILTNTSERVKRVFFAASF